MDSPDPGNSYPPECAELMERTMKCAEAGNIPGCLKLQTKVNDCLRLHGLDDMAVDLPAEYFSLMHDAIKSFRAGDEAQAAELSAKMDEIMYETTGGNELWDDEDVEISEIPADCMPAIQEYMAALNGGQWADARRIAGELQQMMEERGLPPLPLMPPSEEEAP